MKRKADNQMLNHLPNQATRNLQPHNVIIRPERLWMKYDIIDT